MARPGVCAPSARTRVGKDIVPPLAFGAFARMRLTRDTTAGMATLRCRVGSADLAAIDVPDMRGELAIASGLQPMRVEYLLVYGVAP